MWAYRIKYIRDFLCISQNEFAILFGVSFVSVNRWENGHYKPTIKIQRKILRFCKENNIKI